MSDYVGIMAGVGGERATTHKTFGASRVSSLSIAKANLSERGSSGTAYIFIESLLL